MVTVTIKLISIDGYDRATVECYITTSRNDEKTVKNFGHYVIEEDNTLNFQLEEKDID